MMAKILSLVMIGFGTVGQGLAELLLDRHDMHVIAIADLRYGNVIAKDSSVGLNLRDALRLAGNDSCLGQLGIECQGDALAVLDHLKLQGGDVLVEATYSNFDTGQPAFDYLNAALERGMHIASTNKGPFACHYQQLFKKASSRGLRLEFEGTVMSGTPVIKLCRDSLAGTAIDEMRGILNGTVNYVLTKMMAGQSYETALSEAQAAGYAEANPTGDIEGWDAAAKAAILANVAFGAPLTIEQVARTGIDGLSADDIEDARTEGKVWKLVTHLSRSEKGVEGRVAPEMLSAEDPLSHVNGAANGLEIRAAALGTLMISGPGAGRTETGFALLSDLLEIQKRIM